MLYPELYTNLSNAKEGDKVIYEGSSTFGNKLGRILTIVRLTKTLVVCENNIRFQRHTGTQIGCDRWSAGSIHLPALGELEQLEKARTRNMLRRRIQLSMENDKLSVLISDEQLTAACKVLGLTSENKQWLELWKKLYCR